MIYCLNRTIKAGDKLIELCQRIYERHPDCTEKVKKWTTPFLSTSAGAYMQVGDKKNFARITRICSKERARFGAAMSLPLGDKENDDKIWQHYRKLYKRDLPLACINYGKFEEEDGRKHARCGGCLNATYCSKECQLLHWQHHKVDCKANSRRKKSAKRGK